MHSKLLLAATMLAAYAKVWPQSVVLTLLGGAPDGVQAQSAMLNTPGAIVSDRSGNIYFVLKGTRQIVKIDSSGIVRLVAGNGNSGSTGDGGKATAATLNNPISLALDSAGRLYIADSGANKIRRVDTDGIITTVAGTGTAGRTGDGGPAIAATLRAPSGITIDNSGSLLIADTSNHIIRRVTPDGTIKTIAGIPGSSGTAGDEGPALEAYLDLPAGVAADAQGNIYVADTGNSLIRKIGNDGTISRFAGQTSSGGPGGAGDPNYALTATLYAPTSPLLDSAGNLLFVETALYRVRRVTTDGKIASFAGTGTAGASGDGGVARSANLNVQGIALDANGNLLISDGANNRIRIVTASDGIIDTYAGIGITSVSPRYILVDNDNIYFSDSSSHRVRKLTISSRQMSLIAGSGSASYSGDGDDAKTAALNTPRGLALDKSGNLYIADSANHRIRRVGTDGKISTVAGNGTAGTTGDGGSATSAELREPVAVAVDGTGNLYIAERTGQVIRKVTSGGAISTVAGTGSAGAPDSITGVALSQPFYNPLDLRLESSGSLLIVDSTNNRIRRLTPDGNITTVAGSGAATYSGNGGQAISAGLGNPNGVTTDTAGNIIIADTGNNVIRRVGADGVISVIAGSGTRGFNGDGSPATAYNLSSPASVSPGPNCSLMVADTSNQRIRQVFPAVDYSITTNPQGLQVSLDGQKSTSPVVVGLLPGTTHVLDAPSPQLGAAGTRYLATGAQTFQVDCGSTRSALVANFKTQYSISIVADDGGTVTSVNPWQDAGNTISIDASAKTGYVFGGWEGDCTGTGTCRLVMNTAKSIRANFIPSQVQKSSITSGGVIGAGQSNPPVRALSSNAIATIFGANFAPQGTLTIIDSSKLENGRVPTKVGGVCVSVGSVNAPILAVTPTQINFQVPQIVAAGNVPVQVVTGCGTSNELRSDPEPVTAQNATPEFFYFTHNSDGRSPIAAVNATTGSLVGAPGIVAGADFVPSKPGDILTLYGTGFGVTDPAIVPGDLPTQAASVTGAVQVQFGGVTLSVQDIIYAGVSPSSAGLYQLNIRVPEAVPDGDQLLQITVGSNASPVNAYITVKR